jgi:hypothetical protein
MKHTKIIIKAIHFLKCFSTFYQYRSKYDNEINYIICNECEKEVYNKFKN